VLGKVIIISGGYLGNPDFFQKRLEAMNDFIAVCCDGGVRHLDKLKIKPDAVIGDMDSVNGIQLRKLENSGVKMMKYPAEKDATDTQLALEYALSMKPEAIEIWAAGGGRLDHTMANLFLLYIGAEKKISTRMIDEYCEAFIAGKETTFQGTIGQTVSLLAISPKVKGITLSGFKYNLHEENLFRNIPRGISNIITKSPASISVGSGSLLVIRYWQKDIFPEVA